MRKILGYGGLVLSNLTWLSIFGLPFLELPTETKVALGSALYGLSYVLFFGGVALVGKDAIQQMKSLFWGLFRKKENSESNSDSPKLP